MSVMTVKYGSETWYFENGARVKQSKVVPSERSENNWIKLGMPGVTVMGLLNVPIPTKAATLKASEINEQVAPLINLVQGFALPVGVLVASWGLLEIIMGNFGAGKEKIKYSLIGFVGMFIVPNLFYTIQSIFGGN